MEYFLGTRKISFITVLENNKEATIFRHFKGNLYKIVLIASDSETMEDIIVYQKQYDDFGYFARPAKMFFSLIDKKKYPNSEGIYRFEVLK